MAGYHGYRTYSVTMVPRQSRLVLIGVTKMMKSMLLALSGFLFAGCLEVVPGSSAVALCSDQTPLSDTHPSVVFRGKNHDGSAATYKAGSVYSAVLTVTETPRGGTPVKRVVTFAFGGIGDVTILNYSPCLTQMGEVVVQSLTLQAEGDVVKSAVFAQPATITYDPSKGVQLVDFTLG